MVLPILDSITTLFCTWIEEKKGNLTIRISQTNRQIQEINNLQKETKILGFCAAQEEMEDDDL